MHVNSLKDEIKLLFSGQGMPYERVCLTVAMVVTVLLSVLLSGNFAKEARVAVIDLDNSAYTRELITRVNASEYMQVTAVLNTPVDPKTLFYEDKAVAVLYFPQGLEKDRYTGVGTHIGVFYDNTNNAQTADIKVALNELIGLDNAQASGDPGSTNDSLAGSVSLAERILFNPQDSTSNGETLGFLFFFGSMFFVFATIGMVPRLRLTHALDRILLEGTPWDIVLRLIPYGACLIVSFVVGMAILRVWGDLNFSGSLATFLFTQLFYVRSATARNSSSSRSSERCRIGKEEQHAGKKAASARRGGAAASRCHQGHLGAGAAACALPAHPRADGRLGAGIQGRP